MILWGTLLGVVWGIIAAWWYDAAIMHGIVTGILVWGPAVFVAIPGPHAPVVENA